MIEAKDIILILVGVVGSVAANYLFKHFELSGSANEALEQALVASDFEERQAAIRQCLLSAAKWYIVANMFWVVSGAAWILDAIDQGIVRIVLGAMSLFSILYFWFALRWVVRVFKAASSA